MTSLLTMGLPAAFSATVLRGSQTGARSASISVDSSRAEVNDLVVDGLEGLTLARVNDGLLDGVLQASQDVGRAPEPLLELVHLHQKPVPSAPIR